MPTRLQTVILPIEHVLKQKTTSAQPSVRRTETNPATVHATTRSPKPHEWLPPRATTTFPWKPKWRSRTPSALRHHDGDCHAPGGFLSPLLLRAVLGGGRWGGGLDGVGCKRGAGGVKVGACSEGFGLQEGV